MIVVAYLIPLPRFRELLSIGVPWSSGQHESATMSFGERLRQRYAPPRSQNHALTAITVSITQETEVERDLEGSSVDAKNHGLNGLSGDVSTKAAAMAV